MNYRVVEAEPYIEDDNWDGVPVTDNVLTAEETEAPAKKGRPGSPLLQATRTYEKEHRRAEKARKAAQKYAPLINDLNDAEAAEAAALAALTELLG